MKGKVLLTMVVNDKVKVFFPNGNINFQNRLDCIDSLKISRSAKQIYYFLCNYIGPYPIIASLSTRQISDKLFITTRTVIRCLNILYKTGLILKVRNGRNLNNLYYLVWHDAFSKELKDVEIIECNLEDWCEYQRQDMNERIDNFRIKFDYVRPLAVNDTNVIQFGSDKLSYMGDKMSLPISTLTSIKSTTCTQKKTQLIYFKNKSLKSISSLLSLAVNASHLHQQESKDSTSDNPKCYETPNSEINSKEYKESSTGRLIPIEKDKPKDKVHREVVYRIFAYFDNLKVKPKHRIGTQVYKDSLHEIASKLRTGFNEMDIRSVLDKYKLCQEHPGIRSRMNRGHPLELRRILNNQRYGGQFDWWDMFYKNDMDQILQIYSGKKQRATTFDQSNYDSNRTLTDLVAKYYAKEVLGNVRLIDFTRLPFDFRYEKFKETAKQIKRMKDLNPKHPIFGKESKAIELVFKVLKHNYSETPYGGIGQTIQPGHLCSEHTWNTLVPAYLNSQGISHGIVWR